MTKLRFSDTNVNFSHSKISGYIFKFRQRMLKYTSHKHRNKPNRMSDAEIIVILILFHSGGFRCFKHYYQEYVCKHLPHLFHNVCLIIGLLNWRRRCYSH